MDIEEIARQIKALETEFEAKKEERNKEHQLLQVMRVGRVSAYQALEQARKKFQQAEEEEKNQARRLEDLAIWGRHQKRKIDQLKNQFELLLQKDRIHKDYAANIDKFRALSESGTWLAKNRTDGLGAFAYQIDGAIHTAVAQKAILGDKRGLGKSLTSLIWLDLIKSKRAVIVCPADTMDNYIREIYLWSPHRTCVRLGGVPKAIQEIYLDALDGVDSWAIVLNYECWRKNLALLDKILTLKPDALIADEAHIVKEPSTISFRGLAHLRFGGNYCECGKPNIDFDVVYNQASCKSCGTTGRFDEFTTIKHVLPMTGTPILNKPQELFPLCRLIDPINFTSMNKFLSLYCEKEGTRWRWQPGGEKRLLDLLGTKLLVRTREDVGIQIPPPTTIIHRYSMDDLKEQYSKQYQAYQQVREYGQLMLDPDRNITMKMTIYLTVLLRLRQVLTNPSGIELKIKERDANGDEYIKEIVTLDVDESLKMDKCEELVRQLIEEGDRVIVFSQFRDVLFKMKERFGSRAAVYAGGMTPSAKREIQLDFDAKTASENYKYDVVFANYKSGGTGLNFQGANHVVMMDREWNPGKEDQAEGRVDRIGQLKDVFIHILHVEGKSVDEWMSVLIDEKGSLIQQFKSEADASRAVYEALVSGKM